MAVSMAPRPVRRRGGSQRWLVIPLVLTMIVLLVDASMHARSPQPGQLLDSQSWVDKVLPEITQSNAQGLEIARASTTSSPTGAQGAAEQLAQVAAAAKATSAAVNSDRASSQVERASGLLQAALSARALGAGEMAAAASSLLKAGPASPALQQMASAVQDFQVGDSAYRLFVQALPPIGVKMPASQWVDGPAMYQPNELTGFARRLQAAASITSGEKLVIYGITTDPAALSKQGNVELLSPAASVSVTAIVANAGQIPERGVIVTAEITPAEGAPAQRVSTRVDLSAGQADAVQLSGFRLVLSKATTVTVTATPPAGGPGGPTKSLVI